MNTLRVLLIPDSKDVWYAQGIETDYCAQGSDMEDVINKFETGLAATILENIKLNGNVFRLLVPTALNSWPEFREIKPVRVTCETDNDWLKPLQYNCIKYFTWEL